MVEIEHIGEMIKQLEENGERSIEEMISFLDSKIKESK